MQAGHEILIACTLDNGALAQRLAWIRRVTERHLLSHRLEGAVLRLTYGPDALTELEQIVERERECCPFLRFTFAGSGDEAHLTIEAPDGLAAEALWLFDQFLPQAKDAARQTALRLCRGRLRLT